MRETTHDRWEDWSQDECLCVFWWERNQRWAWYGERIEALSLGWWCPVHGTVVANVDGSFTCPWPRVEAKPVPKRRDGRVTQMGLFLGDAA